MSKDSANNNQANKKTEGVGRGSRQARSSNPSEAAPETEDSEAPEDPVERIDWLLRKVEKQFVGDFKASVTDWIRLLKFKQEYEELSQGPKEVTVQWVERLSENDASEK
ncbi:MAG: hypothetical protein ACK5AZ_11615 [Bryobacteraceae bacterium]